MATSTAVLAVLILDPSSSNRSRGTGLLPLPAVVAAAAARLHKPHHDGVLAVGVPHALEQVDTLVRPAKM